MDKFPWLMVLDNYNAEALGYIELLVQIYMWNPQSA